MKRISKSDAQRKLELADKLEKAHSVLDNAISVFNERVTELWPSVTEAIETYNQVAQEVNGFKADIAGAIESYMDDRSDKWREGDAAQSYEEWKSAWEEDIEEAEIDDPDTVEMPELSNGEELRDMEDEVSL